MTDSTNIKTSGIYAHYTVEHDVDDRVTVRGVLRVGGGTGTIIDLVGGEHLEVNGTVMTEWVEPITNYHWSRAIIDPDPDGLYDIDLIRTDEIVPTEVMTPERPLILSLDPAGVVLSDETLTVEWDTTDQGDDVDLYIEGVCIENQAYYGIGDSGLWVSDPILDELPPDRGDCPLTVTVVRNIVGAVNTAFQGGYAEGKAYDGVIIDFETSLQ